LWITPEEDRMRCRKGDMTVTYPIAGSFSIGAGEPFTVDDLFALPDNGNRHEIFDGSLVMSPPPATGHIHVTILLRHALDGAIPDDCYVVSEGLGIYATERDYYIPDILVIKKESIKGVSRRGIQPGEVLLVVEVVSPGNPSNDHVWKRRNYAKFGIEHYWIADPRDKTVLMLTLGEDESYVESPKGLWGLTPESLDIFE
jgi:Uma2 family endonuclease